MRRLALTLTGLGLALALPVAILVARALESATLEEENRHRILAERAFDEMEESLSRFLAAEEARPFDAYRFYPDGAPPRRSPLSNGSSLPFVVGYFQIDPDGSFHTPQIPRNRATAEARGHFAPGEATAQLASTLAAAWRDAESPRRNAMPLAAGAGMEQEALEEELAIDVAEAPSIDSATPYAAPSARPQAPGRFARADEKDFAPRSVSPLRLEAAKQGDDPQEEKRGEERKKAEADLDSYSVYSSLNRAKERRQERHSKVARVQKKVLAKSAPPPVPRFEAGRSSGLSAPATARMEPVLEDELAPTVRVALDPMLGRGVPGERLILYRTVVAGEQGYRQGLLIDWVKLGSWLEQEVVAPSGLGRARATTRFHAAADEPDSATPASGYRFHHRFAEPFDTVAAELTLPVLPGGRGTGTIHALAVLLAVVGAIGLLAVYRMTSVVVRFAERRSRFAASVSHELKTPLTSIRMYAEMLRDGLVPSDEKRAEYYRTITDESERLSRLIDNVLEFSRLERGESELRVAPGDLAAVVRDAVRKLRPHAARRDFALDDAGVTAETLAARFDPDAIIQIVFNTVDNALKYACSTEPRVIEISCARDGDDALLRVRDRGPGIPEAELGRVFEPFYRRDDEETRGTRGSGIGLALVRELAEAMGGSASAHNAREGGLEVSVRLPVSPAPRAPSA